MIRKTLFFLLLLYTAQNAAAQVKLPKPVSKWAKDMVRIPGGAFTISRVFAAPQVTSSDTNLLVNNQPHRITLASYFISDHEVTNAEYKKFVRWVIDSIGPEKLRKITAAGDTVFDPAKVIYKGVAIYPDTACWLKDFTYAHNEPMAKWYFVHSAYDNYPVVGVSWHQANAYCDWLTCRVRESQGGKEDGRVVFRLPWEIEWEYAALGNHLDFLQNETIQQRNVYPWEGHELLSAGGKYYANSGPVTDRNGVPVKEFLDDNAFHTAKIHSYLSNGFSLYDMAGNVAEWTADANPGFYNKEVPDSFRAVYGDDSITVLRKNLQLKSYYEQNGVWFNEKWAVWVIPQMLHDLEVSHRYPQGRIVKGGSWADGPAYLQCGSRTLFGEDHGSSRIGFRVAMDYHGKPGKEHGVTGWSYNDNSGTR
jgi:formylglycine-generating enzyme required for sulfatase activity